MKMFLAVAIATAAFLAGTFAEAEPSKAMCKLSKNPSVEYTCLAEGGSRPCNELEPDGTMVQPQCNRPYYYSSGALPYMRCVGGSWDYIAVCQPECGTITSNGRELRSVVAKRGEAPWHATIYKKSTTPYLPFCAGTLVTTKAVLSVAHCFWDMTNNRVEPAEQFAVAVGKVDRRWTADQDQNAQKSDVSDIKVPPRFRGLMTNFQDDISIVILASEIAFTTVVRPACLDFDHIFERRQLQANNVGKVPAWEFGEVENRNLRVLEMPYVPIEECITSSPPYFREFITSDKICAKSQNGTTLCKGGSGVGLSMPEQERGVTRYYLRGIASVAPRSDDPCNGESVNILFTQITKHEHFIKEFII